LGTRFIMAIRFHIPTYLRAFAGGRGIVAVDTPGRTVNEALAALWAAHPGLRDRVLTEQNEVRRHLNIFVGADNIRDLAGLASAVIDGCEITIVPNVSGG
jgi:molybdopterin synthase sulfur carrier subunit